MSAAKSVKLPSPTPTDPPESNPNYRFFMKAICLNLCFMTAFTLFIIAIGIIISLGHGVITPAPVAVEPHHHSAPDPRPQSISVQHFEHIVQNGNQMANQMRYIVPEAQQMLNDAIRIFYEAMFKVNSIFVPEIPQNMDIVPTEPLTEATTTTTATEVREKRDLKSQFSDEDRNESLLSLLPRREQEACVDPSLHFRVMRRIFGPPNDPEYRAKRDLKDEDLFNPSDLDPLNLEFWGQHNALLEDMYDDADEELRNKIRKKRRAEIKVRQLKEQFVRCKKMDQPSEKCHDIYKEVLQLMNSLKMNINSVQGLLDRGNPERGRSGKDHVALKDTPHTPNKLQTSLSAPELPSPSRVGFHEDMMAVDGDYLSVGEPRQWIDTTKFINQLTNQKIHNSAQQQKFAPRPVVTPLIVSQRQQNGEGTATNVNQQQQQQQHQPQNAQSDFVAASGPFLSLCEKYARQGTPNLNPLNSNQQHGQNLNQNSNNNNNQQNPLNVQNPPSIIGFTSWSPQFSNRGVPGGGAGGNGGSSSTPITGESMHATAKVLFNPGMMGVAQNPVCFTAVPVQQRVNGNFGFINVNNNQNKQVIPLKRHCKTVGGACNSDFVFPTLIGTGESNDIPDDEPNLFGIQPRSFDGKGNGVMYVAIPTALGGMSGNQGFRNQLISAQGLNIPVMKTMDNSNALSFCTFSPVNSMTLPVHYVTTQMRTNDDGENILGSDKESSLLRHMPTSSDIIYATYARNIMERANLTIQDHCKSNEISCFTGSQCISDKRWCDNIVDCLDASDESACSCKSRLDPKRICDGYPDCPMGNDELGCFGCDAFSFSCYRTKQEFEMGRSNQCYTLKDRCDGFSVCFNGADERSCSMLVRNLGQQLSFQVSYLEGYLYRNYQGMWYPVCQRPRAWATEACDDENGSLNEKPVISHRIGTIPGMFIQPSNGGGEPKFTDNCDDKIVHVKCREPKCGDSVEPLIPVIRVRNEGGRASSVALDTNDERVVGGTESEPHSWPFIVAIFKDGDLHCGATIYNELWIVVAAHCFNQFESHYYEVRAGMLRRQSFSPMTQIVKISHVHPHPEYERKTMLNDIAMARVETPFSFNRWVRPICLPSPDRCGMAENWKMGPKVRTICTAIGWGALYEKGPGPDHLHEVSVPIIERCKSVLDNIGGSICAGEPQGGRDACQGDSGGPFLCRSERDQNEWYLAGIISHGDGCARANEPGVYTRVSLYLEWIDSVLHEELKENQQPLQTCPGYMCIWGGERCIPAKRRCDRNINCLGGEDEVNCIFEESIGSANNGTMAREGFSTTPGPQSDALQVQSTIEPPKSDQTTEEVHENLIEDEPILPDVLENIPHVVPPTTSTTTTTTTVSTTTSAPIDVPKILDDNPKPLSTTSGPTSFDWSPTIAPNHQDSATKVTITTTTTTAHTIIATTPASDFDGESRGDLAPSSFQTMTVFECKKISQEINMKHRCDKFKDCQDGTDEEGCTCRDYLVANKTSLICNGHMDCADKTDEENCLNCSTGEYKCLVSGQCIQGHLRCNQIMDCPFGEDEMDCYTLTDGHTVHLDADNRPTLNFKGFVTQNTNGVWSVLCDGKVNLDRLGGEIAGQVCLNLETKGYQFYNKTVLPTSTLDVSRRTRQSLKHIRDQFELDQFDMRPLRRNSNEEGRPSLNLEDFELIVGSEKEECRALFVECIPFATTQHEEIVNPEDQTKVLDLRPLIHPAKKPTVVVEPAKETHGNQVTIRFPWVAEVFVNGQIKGIGIILDHYWVLTTSFCLESIDVYRDYVTVLLGKTTTHTAASGPYEQISRIDCIHAIPNSKIVLLHLENPCHYSRAVLPTIISQIKFETNIFVVMRNKLNHLLRFVASHLIDCDTPGACYHTGFIQDIQDIISDRDHNQMAMIVGFGKGDDDIDGWYPKAFHKFENITTGNFNESIPLLQYHKTISSIIDYPYCQHSIRAPICMNGFRCPLGECLDRNVICNGIQECRDGSDERNEHCESRYKACPVDHFLCGNGRCIPKIKYCDGVDHCGDRTDEPRETCSCFTYLQVTDPHRICDGINNCYDKTDEDPRYCRCNQHNVPCGNSGFCVSKDSFCDGVKDCPGGEDEHHCHGIHYHTTFARESNDYGEVMRQTFGLWHTKCFNKTTPPSQEEMVKLCQKMGYERDPKVEIRIIDEVLEADRPKATKPVLNSAYSNIPLNDKFHLLLKPSKPVAKLVHWEKTDVENCYRLEIRCEGTSAREIAQTEN